MKTQTETVHASGSVTRTAGHKPDDIHVSFEFFPPKNARMENQFWASIRRLEPLNPDFFSVTYGAGGATRERTRRTVTRMVSESRVAPAVHLTCVGVDKPGIDDMARDYWNEGVKHIIALRGDPPGGMGEDYTPHPDGYAYGSDLVAGLKSIADFEISVSAYPERHPESADWQVEIDNLKRKVDAGAARAITQFFLTGDTFLKFEDRVRAAGIHIPIVPGLMLQPDYRRLKCMARMCGVHVPEWYADLFDGLDNDEDTRLSLTSSVVSELIAELHDEGVRHFHFYTLNRAELAYAASRVLGLHHCIQDNA
ncbi:MAG: methylenetetrahydrofolate reductase [Hyphomonadaceae bacterium]|nr:methylenetetrahydrofolate reductase [Hyphomonadaceae bacterium]MBC6412748.1 methylenetetrahydrofolate reductase [Hyphomonadaceae bacterium]